MEQEPVLRFTVSRRPFALPLNAVAQVIEMPACTTVPGAPPGVIGLADVRGKVVTVLDLAELLDLPPSAPSRDTLAVLLSGAYSHVALVVERQAEIGPGGGAGEGPFPLIDVPNLILNCARRLRARQRAED